MRKISSMWPLAVSVPIAIGATLFARDALFYDGIVDDMSSWGVFFSVFGVVYAIIAGFLLVEVLQRYGSLSTILEEELNSLQDIRDFLLYIDGNHEKVKKDILKSLKVYGDSVAKKEWKEMSDISRPTDSDTSEELRDLIIATNGINASNDSDVAALSSIMAEISKVTTLRTKRISLADAQLPPRLKVLLSFMSVALVVGFVFLAVVNVWVHLFIVVAVVMAIHLMYIIVDDLDTPFDGVWNLSNDHFQQFVRRLN